MSFAGRSQLHFEPFVHLVDVTERSALVAWGGFYLRQGDDGWLVVDDDELPDGRTSGGTIGVESAPYGQATVDVFDDGRLVASASTVERNHVWVEGLEPDHEYRYRVDGGRCRMGWSVRDGIGSSARAGGGLAPSGRRYDQRLRTHPHADDDVPVAVLAVGDYGVGIVNGDDGRRQLAVARTMERLAANRSVRALVSLGDNIYHGPEDQLAQTGAEDDDWYFTFYEPYRYLIDHLPLYPAAGNHDGADEELNDDRAQLADNFHLQSRFRRGRGRRARLMRPGPVLSSPHRRAAGTGVRRHDPWRRAGTPLLRRRAASAVARRHVPRDRRAARSAVARALCATTRRGARARTTPAWSSSSTG